MPAEISSANPQQIALKVQNFAGADGQKSEGPTDFLKVKDSIFSG
jgi:hypothetical protein